ncbi:MAG: hypothetical protein NZM03_06470 [Limisphaera sp.]|nr:hypothetical protein [Limisphaera sp.]
MQLSYNGDGLRVRKTVGTTSIYYLVDDRNLTGYAQVLEEHEAVGGGLRVCSGFTTTGWT